MPSTVMRRRCRRASPSKSASRWQTTSRRSLADPTFSSSVSRGAPKPLNDEKCTPTFLPIPCRRKYLDISAELDVATQGNEEAVEVYHRFNEQLVALKRDFEMRNKRGLFITIKGQVENFFLLPNWENGRALTFRKHPRRRTTATTPRSGWGSRPRTSSPRGTTRPSSTPTSSAGSPPSSGC